MDKVCEQDPNLVEKALGFFKFGRELAHNLLFKSIMEPKNGRKKKFIWNCHFLMVPLPLSLSFAGGAGS